MNLSYLPDLMEEGNDTTAFEMSFDENTFVSSIAEAIKLHRGGQRKLKRQEEVNFSLFSSCNV